MDKKKEIIFSEPVREIISNPPPMIVKSGTVLIWIIFAVIIFFSWLIKYPDIIPAPIEITTTTPPVTLVSRISGKITSLYVADGDTVKSGQILAIMENPSVTDDVFYLISILDSIKNGNVELTNFQARQLSLGEIQELYSVLLGRLSDLNSFNVNDLYGNRILSLEEEISGLQNYIRDITTKERLLIENVGLELKKYKRDSLLFSNDVLTASDIEKSRQNLNLARLELQNVRLDKTSKGIEVAKKNQQLEEYRIEKVDESDRLNSEVQSAFLNLTAGVEIWRNNYLLVAPFDGKAAFTRYWKENQTVEKDEDVITVIPEREGEYVGRIKMSMQRSGKVVPGLKVNIKLSSYPYLEYGMLKGVVRSKSLVPDGDGHIIEVELPQGLKTRYGKTLEYSRNMQGRAEIITDNLRIIQKIINPFKHLASRSDK